MKKVSLLIFTGLLVGCSILGKEEPLPLYTLKSETFEPTNALSAPLAVDLPVTEASLNTSRIAVTPAPYQRDYIADGQWPEQLPKVLQVVLLESLGQRWGGTYVNRVGAGLQAKYILQTEIQDFSVYHINEGCPEIHQKITFKLIDLRERNVLAAQTFSQTTPALSSTMRGLVEAFNKGLHCLLEQAVPWMEDIFSKRTRS